MSEIRQRMAMDPAAVEWDDAPGTEDATTAEQPVYDDGDGEPPVRVR